MTSEHDPPVSFPSISQFKLEHPNLSDEEVQVQYETEYAAWRKARRLDEPA